MRKNDLWFVVGTVVILILLAFVIAILVPRSAEAICIDAASVPINWAPNPEPDIAGYKLLRSVNGPAGDYTVVHAGLIANTPDEEDGRIHYVDTGLEYGCVYHYTLQAVDLCNNESPESLPSEIVVPDFVDEEGNTNPATPSAPIVGGN